VPPIVSSVTTGRMSWNIADRFAAAAPVAEMPGRCVTSDELVRLRGRAGAPRTAARAGQLVVA
jgi:hypothetical protein